MHQIKVVNLKCEGCANSIIRALEKEGLSDVKVDVAGKTVSFEGDLEKGQKILAQIGYPEQGNQEAARITKKAKSFVSCFIGKIGKRKQ